MFKSEFNEEPAGSEELGKSKGLPGWAKGLIIGLIAAAAILAVVLAVLFLGPWKKKAPEAAGAGEAAKLRFTVITSRNCQDCFDIQLLIDAIKQNNIKETGLEILNIEDSKTKKILEQYKIAKVPTLLVAGELEKDEVLKNAWPQIGEIVDGVFVFRQIIPPYIDVATGQLKGATSVVYLSDQACAECYNISLHESALKNLGIIPKESKTVDVSSDEGKELVKKYAIAAVPTMIVRGELDEYLNFQQVWPLVGKVDSDGSYIFTKLDEMGSYYDLEKGKLVEVAAPAGADAAALVQ